MNYRELNDAINDVKDKIKMDTEVKIGRPSGQYTIDGVEFDEEKNALVIASLEEEKQFKYRLQFIVTKEDGQIIALDTKTEFGGCDDDIIMNLEDFGYKYLKEMGIDGEIQDKTGSVKVVVKRKVLQKISPKTGKELKKPREVEVEEPHFYRFKMLEVMRELDSDNDVYIRIWKNGYVA